MDYVMTKTMLDATLMVVIVVETMSTMIIAMFVNVLKVPLLFQPLLPQPLLPQPLLPQPLLRVLELEDVSYLTM